MTVSYMLSPQTKKWNNGKTKNTNIQTNIAICSGTRQKYGEEKPKCRAKIGVGASKLRLGSLQRDLFQINTHKE